MLIDANRFDLLEELILAEPLRHGQPVVLIDGRSGAGKTTLANTLICHHADWQLVHADDLYPGWSGLSAVWDLRDLVARRRYRRWDWYQNRFDDEVILDANRYRGLRGTDADECTFGILASVVRSLRTAQAPPGPSPGPRISRPVGHVGRSGGATHRTSPTS